MYLRKPEPLSAFEEDNAAEVSEPSFRACFGAVLFMIAIAAAYVACARFNGS
jgi:hypothetical protein